jgi:heme/copper-type cytochrome/quinol oxidase subunit 2
LLASTLAVKPRRPWKPAILVLIVVTAAALLGLYVYLYGTGPSTPTGGPSLMSATCDSVANETRSTVEHVASGGNSSHAYFLIIEGDPNSPYAGLNGSYYVPLTTQWPIMYVHVGQVVSFHVINCASSEAHGFQISYYDDKSIIAVQPGESYDVTFTATQAGTFRVYCDIFCAIHATMQNGALIVTQ